MSEGFKILLPGLVVFLGLLVVAVTYTIVEWTSWRLSRLRMRVISYLKIKAVTRRRPLPWG